MWKIKTTKMSDNLQKKRPQDASRINTSEQWELDYWIEALGVSEQELKEAVKAVGNAADNVRKYLRK
jgi:hypothetical protein